MLYELTVQCIFITNLFLLFSNCIMLISKMLKKLDLELKFVVWSQIK